MISWIILFIIFGLFFQTIGLITITFSFIIFLIFKGFLTKDSINLFIEKSTEGNLFQKIDKYEVDMNQEIFDIDKIDSYKDILYSGSENEKIDLIGMVVFNPTKEFISLIRIALNDENETVRILASNSLQKFENFFEEKIELLTKKFQESNDDKYLINLIKTYEKYIESTLLDDFLHKKYIDEIFSLFKKIDNLESKKEVYNLYLKLSIKYKCTNELETKLINFVQNNNTNENIFMICEYFYKKSKFEQIYKYLEKVDIKQLKSTNLKNIYKFWMSNAI